MIGQLNNNHRTWVRRGNAGHPAAAHTDVFVGAPLPHTHIDNGMMSDRTAFDFKGVHGSTFDQGLARDFSNGGDILETMTTARGPALLVMAQNYRHNERARYNG